MTFIICTLAFFVTLYLTLTASNIIRTEDRETKYKIEDRLKVGDKTITSFRLEKKERMSDLAFLDRLLRRLTRAKKLQHFLTQSGLSLSVGSFLLTSSLLGALVLFICALFKVTPMISIPCAAFAASIPFFVVNAKRANRIKQFSHAFPDAIGMITGSLRVGHSLQMAMETVVHEGNDIVAHEFEHVLSEVEVGQNFESALKAILTRIDTPELKLFVSAVVLQRETGGNLAELFDNLEIVIRERQNLKRELKATTSQARFSGIVLSLLPVFVSMMIFFIHPEFITFFGKDPIGIKLLIFCVVGQCIGMFWIRNIVQIEL